jgi:uncharacterized membrane protein (UPF0182 family)
MFVVPIENSFLYVKPIYLEADAGSIPQVIRVIVAYGVPGGDGVRLAYQATLDEALEELFGPPGVTTTPGTGNETTGPGEGDGARPPSGTETTPELIRLASEAFENALRAQRSGDWAAYGRYMSQVEEYLNRLSVQ